MSERVDTVVIGAGVIGAAAAWHAAAHGRTLLLEAHALLHDRGSSHGGSRIFRHAYEDRAHVRLAVAADALWQQLEGESGERLLHRVGGLDLGDARNLELTAIEGALRAEGRPVARLGAAEIRARFPTFALGDEVEALYQADAAVIPATRAVATLLRSAVARGAELRDRTPVIGIEPLPDGVRVRLPAGVIEGARLVVAAGPWLARLLPGVLPPLRIEAQQVVYLRVGREHAAHAPGRMPLFIDRRGGIYGFPLFEKPHALKVSDHQGAPEIDLDDRPVGWDEARTAATVAAARALLPHLSAEVVGVEQCLYTKTPDERFLLDRHPEHPQVVVAGGGSGHAFKFGPLLGKMAADLSRGVALPPDAAPFALARFASTGG
jgi:monomeric sarcosine oxidase